MNKVNLIAFQLPTNNYVVVNAKSGEVLIQNVTENYLDTGAIHNDIYAKYGDIKWNLTYVRMEHWNRPIEVGDKSIKIWSDEVENEVSQKKYRIKETWVDNGIQHSAYLKDNGNILVYSEAEAKDVLRNARHDVPASTWEMEEVC